MTFGLITMGESGSYTSWPAPHMTNMASSRLALVLSRTVSIITKHVCISENYNMCKSYHERRGWRNQVIFVNNSRLVR